ncbi:MAG: hypothetical protein LC687_06725, partial [Actinobacteria bacterium]|nr:hypothetical protein [Actinomycetota bacterium]
MNPWLFGNTLEPVMQSVSTDSVILASALLFGLVFFTLHHKYHQIRPFVFYVFSAVTFIATTVLLISTVLLQTTSDISGNAHSQAEIEFWVCDTEIKPNTSPIHSSRQFDQANKRIAVSGFADKASSTTNLGAYLRAIGGELQSESIKVPLEDDSSDWLAAGQWIDGDPQGDMDIAFVERYMLRNNIEGIDGSVIDITDGQRCPDSSDTELQVFVYTADSQANTYQQHKLDNPAEYVLTRNQSVPPGDCIIVEFSQPKDTTDKLCPGYGLRDNLRCTAFGVSRINDQLCSYQEIRQPE